MSWVVYLSLVLVFPLLQACGTVIARNPLPDLGEEMAEIEGLPEEARFWGDGVPESFLERMRNMSNEEIEEILPAWVGGSHHYIAISGGGQDGAYTAGMMNGWTASGTRPEFLLVTGVSTGALAAPFVFLGPDYDEDLKEVYTTVSTDDLLELRYWTEIATGDSVVDSAKLRAVIAKFVDEKMIDRLAEEHRRGRRLFIGTTNLDAKRPVIWNITVIAASDYPKKRELIGDVLLASASIPGALPPVLIEVQKDGVVYDELHVDGGTVEQVFVYPSALDFKALLERLQVSEPPTIYVIRNSKLKPDYEAIDPSIYDLAGTSISSLIRTQGLGDLNQIYLLAERDGGEFRLAYIPDDFEGSPKEFFDKDYMNTLYQLGYEKALKGYPWQTLPPGVAAIKVN